MKIVIFYHSEHHNNTKKLVDAIAKKADYVKLCSDTVTNINLAEYDLIGFASGIYYQKFHKNILKFAQENLPEGKKVFLLYTCGTKKDSYTKAIEQIAKDKKCQVLGRYGCLGYDTYGPFKLVGGIAKNKPDDDDINAAVNFFEKITKKV